MIILDCVLQLFCSRGEQQDHPVFLRNGGENYKPWPGYDE